MTRPVGLEVGSIGKPHGLRGEVMVRLITDRTERVAVGSELSTGSRDLIVAASRPHQKGWIVAFEGVAGRDEAESLRGSTLYAEPLDDPDILWVHDLVGCRIADLDDGDHGVVVAVEANPASDLLVTDGGFLVPLAFMVEVRDRTVIVDPPPGLFDDEAESPDR